MSGQDRAGGPAESQSANARPLVALSSLVAGALLVAGGLSFAQDDSRLPKASGPEARGAAILERQGCRSCHSIGGRGGSIGPPLDDVKERVLERLGSQEYRARLQRHNPEALEEIVRAPEGDRFEVWLRLHLADPRSLNPDSKMPRVRLASDEELSLLAAYLDDL